MSNPILQTFALTKSYKGFKALDGVSMCVNQGDIYGFVGENGAGKTTLIRVVAGLTMGTEGEYALFGVSCKDPGLSKAKKGLSAIVESVAVNRGLTALENLKMQCLIAKISKTDGELNDLLTRVGLDPVALAKKTVGGFSLGMRQRLGLAIALVSDPKLILLDEPMNGLDPQGFVDMRETILALNKQGVSFLISSHILSELDKMCTRVGFLSHGKLLQEITMEELRDKARKKIVLRAKDPEDLKARLAKHFDIKDAKIEGDSLTLYDPLDINEVIAALAKDKILVEGIYAGEETIEDYYRQIMTGEVRS